MPKETFFNLPEEKRERILNIAVEEFSKKPYEVASISRIVRQAEIAKGSFYQYFEDKRDLYQYLVKLSTDKKLELLKELPTPDPQADLFGYFSWLFKSAVTFEIQNPQLAAMLYRAFIDEVPFPEMTKELRRRGTTQFFKQLLSQGILHGEVAAYVDSDLAAFLMETIYYQFGRYAIERLSMKVGELAQKEGTSLDAPKTNQLTSNLMDILEAGIKRNPEQRETYFN